LADRWERYLERWTTAGLIEPSTAERVRAYEAQQEKKQRLRWPVVLAIGLGGLLLGAGVLLFEHIPDPSRLQGEELWAEVTIPKKGLPRPIRLGVKKGTDPIIPLDLK
jgi:hypothetical protein